MSGQFWAELAEDLKDPEFLREYVTESVRIATVDAIVNAVDEALRREHLSKADLARAIGAQPASVRRLLSARNVNPTLGTVAEVAAVLGLRLTLEPIPESDREIITDPLRTGAAADARRAAQRLTEMRTRRAQQETVSR
ncbi:MULTISPECIES: helix-turn-helix transcriptional regulator [unclassified Crossiella]|uniref:helix-turn-helix domain-containing protein n=1 Tax=unclassified Crossiella TaxID=2620835 RepID=UPI001FFEB730|nr:MULTISPECIES: helix-turn-helix transcriptional regulator [unclassified Crossiella]MCK2242376.1 helix-turn-helix transcriptional regulator [Crossiella sp. S99.2]MCK2254593.1 helix-turn-helix transcriptional regulator [Crossiella sp. S99.1]